MTLEGWPEDDEIQGRYLDILTDLKKGSSKKKKRLPRRVLSIDTMLSWKQINMKGSATAPLSGSIRRGGSGSTNNHSKRMEIHWPDYQAAGSSLLRSPRSLVSRHNAAA